MAKAVFMVSGAKVERFLSEAKEIRLTGLSRSGQALYGKCSFRDLDKLKDLAREFDLEFNILLLTYRPLGYFLVALFITSFLLTFLWASRLWTFVYNSNDDRFSQIVHEELWKNGLRPGSKIKIRDCQKVGQELMKKIPELNFISFKRDGIRLNIDINARALNPEEIFRGEIYASLGGIVRSVSLFLGECLVRPGDVVYKGQLLVQGTPYAKAEIMGETIVEITKQVLTSDVVSMKSGQTGKGYQLKIGGLSYGWGFKMPKDGNWDKTHCLIGWAGSRRQFVELTLIKYERLIDVLYERTEDEALQLAMEKIEKEFFDRFKESRLIEKKIQTTLSEDGKSVTLRAIIETDLAAERLGESIDRASSSGNIGE